MLGRSEDVAHHGHGVVDICRLGCFDPVDYFGRSLSSKFKGKWPIR